MLWLGLILGVVVFLAAGGVLLVLTLAIIVGLRAGRTSRPPGGRTDDVD